MDLDKIIILLDIHRGTETQKNMNTIPHTMNLTRLGFIEPNPEPPGGLRTTERGEYLVEKIIQAAKTYSQK